MEISSLYQLFLQYPRICTDSRKCSKDSIFFALKGENFNGNAFAAKALEAGCAYAIIDEELYDMKGDNRLILVNNVLKVLQDLANYHRRQLGTKIIGITGTNGKTTTKELVAAVLQQKYNVLYTEGNLNNSIGVPLTLLRLKPEHDIAIVEMGASHPGDIKELVEIAEPNYGIITNVGMAHLQGFGSLEGVIKTKGELYEHLRAKKGSLVFINKDNELLTNIAGGLDCIYYGCSGKEEGLSVSGKVIDCTPYLHFQWKTADGAWQDVQTNLIGSYNIDNMLAAATIGLHSGVKPEQINIALSEYIPQNNRSQLKHTEYNHLIIDAYNANPTSMTAALKNFSGMNVSPKMVILGDMKELGECSLGEHERIANILSNSAFDKVWLVGNEFSKIPTPPTFVKFNDVEQVNTAIQKENIKGFYILIKGSNSMRLIQTVEYL